MAKEQDSWRHVIVLTSALLLLCCPSTNFSNGVLFVAIKATKLYSDNAISWLISVNNTIHALGGPVGSVLIHWLGLRAAAFSAGLLVLIGYTVSGCVQDIRLLFFFYATIVGLGRGIGVATATVSIGYWFPENTSLASGLSFVGVGIGMLIHPRLLQALVDMYDLQWALMLTGAISFHTCACAMLLRPSPFEKAQARTMKIRNSQETRLSLKEKLLITGKRLRQEVLQNYSFLFFSISMLFFSMAIFNIVTFLPDFFNSHGSTPQESALAASITGSGSLVARVLAGIMTNDPRIGNMLLLQGNCGISALATFFINYLVEYQAGRFIYALCIGTYLSSVFVILGPVTMEKVGVENLAYGFGFIYFMTAIGNLAGPPLAVEVRSYTQSYYAVFVFIGCLLSVTCLCGFISEMLKVPEVSKKEHTSMELKLLSKTLIMPPTNGGEDEGESARIESASARTEAEAGDYHV